jgi:hypothetical protein
VSADAALTERLVRILAADPQRMAALSALRSLDLPDGWIGAGFVRDAVWDALHGRPSAVHGDVDVIWFDAARRASADDRVLEARLASAEPSFAWSVKNQARMHDRNGDPPYRSCADAMRHWPETATTVAVRLDMRGVIECLAPFGLADLFGLIVRPTSRFAEDKRPIFDARIESKRWLSRYPRLKLCAPL